MSEKLRSAICLRRVDTESDYAEAQPHPEVERCRPKLLFSSVSNPKQPIFDTAAF
jgi:hypothetical protein